MAGNIVHDPDRWEKLLGLMESGASLREIERSGIDHKTVKRHFPDYKPYRRGGWKEEGGALRQMTMDFREFERTGKITTEDEKTEKKRKLEALHKHEHENFAAYGRMSR